MDFILSLVAFVVAISLLVAVHEFGHFWVARRLGFKVLRFSIGFGKPLWRWRGRDPDRVEYWISSLPLGGDVKMLDEREGPVDDAERDRSFNRRPVPHRIAVLLAGPGFNFLFAIAAYWLMFVSGVPSVRAVVDEVEPGSLAAEAGLAPAQIIESVGGRPTETLEDAVLAMFDEMLADGRIELGVRPLDGSAPGTVELDVRGRLTELTKPDALFPGLGVTLGPGTSLVPAEIDRVDPGSPAERSGLKAGDRIVAAAGGTVRSWQQWVNLVRARPGETIPARVLRDGEEIALELTIGTADEDGVEVGRIGTWPVGVLPEDVVARIRVEQRYGPVVAVAEGAAKTWEMTALTVRMIGRMITGDVSLRSTYGPIGIAGYAGDSAAAGFTAFVSFLAIVSISLGIMNLLPIPILDGGQILFQIAEGMKGSPLSERAMAFGQQLGLVFLIALMSLAFYNDLSRLFAT
jgi:regulator of sigma E protease